VNIGIGKRERDLILIVLLFFEKSELELRIYYCVYCIRLKHAYISYWPSSVTLKKIATTTHINKLCIE